MPDDLHSPPPAGHNAPPLETSLAMALDLRVLDEQLRATFAPLIQRAGDLAAGHARFKLAHPEGIPSEQVAGAAGDFVRQVAAALEAIDQRRTTVKAPVLDATRKIDGFAKEISEPLRVIRQAVEHDLNRYVAAQRAAAEEARRKEAERLEAEAQRLAAQAQRQDDDDTMARAVQAEQEAEALKAAPAATGPIVRSDLGTAIGVRKGPWRVRITDAAKIPREYLMPNEPKLLAEAKTKSAIGRGEQPIPGVEFYREEKVSVR